MGKQKELITNKATQDATALITQHAANFAEIDKVLKEYNALGEDVGEFTKTLHMSNALLVITDKLKPALPLVRALMDSPSGFKTDEQSRIDGGKEGYGDDDLLSIIASVLLDGYYLFNNEFNIIGGNRMIVKNGLRRKCQEHEDVRAIDIDCGMPRSTGTKMVVDVRARYEMKDAGGEWQKCGFDKTFSIRVNQGMLDDAIIGKAERRAWKTLYEKVTGGVFNEVVPDGMQEESETPPETNYTLADFVSPVDLQNCSTDRDFSNFRKATFQKINATGLSEEEKKGFRDQVLNEIRLSKEALATGA